MVQPGAQLAAGQLAQQLSMLPCRPHHNNIQHIDTTCCTLPLITPKVCHMHKLSFHNPTTSCCTVPVLPQPVMIAQHVTPLLTTLLLCRCYNLHTKR
jgi:hypothetical protein